jgi:hypothetical protein
MSDDVIVKDRPEYVPEKFWNAELGEVRVKALLDSYKALEKKLAEKKPYLVPAAASEYEISIKDDFFAIDPELNARLLAKGFNQEQVQEVYDLAVEHMLPMILSIASDYKADREAEKLVAHFGGMDQWSEMARQLKAYGQKSLSSEALQGLAGSYDGILALHKMMMNDIGDGITARGKSVGMSSITDINQMMKNPKYWRDHDPSFIAKVTEAFERVYD